MIRATLAECLLDYLAFSKSKRGKYRLAQFASRFLDGVVIRSVYGPLLHCRFADSTFWLAARYGNDDVMRLLADLSPTDGFIDVGANIGLTTCFAATKSAAVLSLEPSAREFADLLKNVGLLHVTPPVVLPMAANHRNEFSSFRIGHLSHSGGNSLGSSRDANERDVMVSAVQLDDLLSTERLRGWRAMYEAYEAHSIVVKIDVEGFESQVIAGMQRLLSERRCRKVIVEENHTRAEALIGDQDLTTTMARFGYKPTVLPAGRNHFDQCYLPTSS